MSKTFTIATTDDSMVEPTEVFLVGIGGLDAGEATIDLETSSENDIVGVPGWPAFILDNDTTPTVSITGGSAVTEGGKAEFTVSAAQEVASDLTVQLTVTDAGGSSDFIASGNQGGKSVVIAKGERSATYEVQTQGDSTDEPDAGASSHDRRGSVCAPGLRLLAGSAQDPVYHQRHREPAQPGPQGDP